MGTPNRVIVYLGLPALLLPQAILKESQNVSGRLSVTILCTLHDDGVPSPHLYILLPLTTWFCTSLLLPLPSSPLPSPPACSVFNASIMSSHLIYPSSQKPSLLHSGGAAGSGSGRKLGGHSKSQRQQHKSPSQAELGVGSWGWERGWIRKEPTSICSGRLLGPLSYLQTCSSSLEGCRDKVL